MARNLARRPRVDERVVIQHLPCEARLVFAIAGCEERIRNARARRKPQKNLTSWIAFRAESWEFPSLSSEWLNGGGLGWGSGRRCKPFGFSFCSVIRQVPGGSVLDALSPVRSPTIVVRKGECKEFKVELICNRGC